MDALAAESIFCAIGLDAILAGKPTLYQYQVEKAVNLPRVIRRRISAFLASDSFKPAREMSPFDYDETLAQIGGGELGKKQIAALRAVTDDGDLAMELGQQATHAIAFGAAKIPRPTPDDLTGELEQPDEHSIADFARVWEVARDPLSVLGDLEDGSLMDDQVAALAELCPAWHAEMKQAATTSLGAIAARKGKNWRPNPTKVALLRTLRQEDAVDADLLRAVQQVYAHDNQPAQPPAAPSKSRSRAGKTSDMGEGTKGQDAAAGEQS